MAKTKVTFIICYFGKFPSYIDLFLRSCSINTNYNWLIFTWEEGKVCRIIQSNNEQTEYSYIHLQKRPFTQHNPDLLKVKSFYIHPFSFDEKKTDHLSLTQEQIKTIKKSKIKNLRSSLIYKYHLVINWILYNKKPVKRQY